MIRRQYLSHEASVKSMGTLYFLGSIILTISGVMNLLTISSKSGGIFGVVMAALFLGLAALQFWLGRGLRRLDGGVRIVAIVFAAIGLLGFPIGTLISGYFLYLLVSQKGQMVFSPQYQDIIAATPHVKYKTSVVVWILLGLVVLLVVFGIGAALLSSARNH
jgi:hypothetical protein